MNFNMTMLLTAAGILLYMYLGYRVVKALSKEKDMNPTVMMSGFDRLAYEAGEEYGRKMRKIH